MTSSILLWQTPDDFTRQRESSRRKKVKLEVAAKNLPNFWKSQFI